MSFPSRLEGEGAEEWSPVVYHKQRFQPTEVEDWPGVCRGKEDEKRVPEEAEQWEDEEEDPFTKDFEAKQEEEPPELRPPANDRPPEGGEADEGEDEESKKAREQLEQEMSDQPAKDDRDVDHEMDMDELEKPGWLIPHFTVLKYDPKNKSVSKHKRVWAIDMCRRLHMNMDVKGDVKKTHQAQKLLVIEKNIMRHNMAKLMFFDAAHAYELVFQHGADRERFYECSSAIRPMRTWCPDLCKQGVDNSRTVINTRGQIIKVDLGGKLQEKEMEEQTEVFASRIPHERVKLWTGTLNLDAKPPPSFEQMEKWIPRDEHDLYVVAVQDASYRKDENEWYRYVARFFGKPFMIIAQMTIWDNLLCVVARKKVLSKIANVEGFTRATKDHVNLNLRGGCAISFKYHETSFCFLSVHLPDFVHMSKARTGVMNEIWDEIRIANMWTDLTQQFHHFFVMGAMNYYVQSNFDEAMELVEAKKWPELVKMDQLKDQMEDDGIFYGMQEAEINFPPTSLVKRGTGNEYIKAKDKLNLHTPSYTDRIMWKNNPTAWYFKNFTYNSHPEVTASTHIPVSATFELDCQRPFISVFGHDEISCDFIFERVDAEISHIIKTPQLQVYGHMVDKEQYSQPLKTKTEKPSWGAAQLPKMHPMIYHKCLLETQFFVLMIRDGKGGSGVLRGSAIVPLKEAVQKMGELVTFDVHVEYRCKKIGKMSGSFKCVETHLTPTGAPAKKK